MKGKLLERGRNVASVAFGAQRAVTRNLVASFGNQTVTIMSSIQTCCDTRHGSREGDAMRRVLWIGHVRCRPHP